MDLYYFPSLYKVDTSTFSHTFGNNRLLPEEKNKITAPGERERERERERETTDRINFPTTVLLLKNTLQKKTEIVPLILATRKNVIFL
jgi:hypothetical protein